jgi:hypothetical protein
MTPGDQGLRQVEDEELDKLGRAGEGEAEAEQQQQRAEWWKGGTRRRMRYS